MVNSVQLCSGRAEAIKTLLTETMNDKTYAVGLQHQKVMESRTFGFV